MIPKKLHFTNKKRGLYVAGLPTFARNFSRDSFYAGLISNNTELLKNQLQFSSEIQANQANPHTGAEPGKIHHEYPGVDIMGKNTLFAACDTTGLFLIAAQHVANHFPEEIEAIKPNLERAVEYILNHLKDGIFWEDPSLAEADEFALKVTYWKDSSLAKRTDGKPKYPISYLINQAITINALRSAEKLLNKNFDSQITLAIKGFKSFFNQQNGQWNIAKDSQGDLMEYNSDILHSLYFLQPEDLSQNELNAIKIIAKKLETPWGFRTSDPLQCTLETKYHSCSLWPFEQAVIHAGLQKFGCKNEAKIAQQITKVIDGDKNLWELFYVFDTQISPAGCNPQLWTYAAWQYFLTSN